MVVKTRWRLRSFARSDMFIPLNAIRWTILILFLFPLYGYGAEPPFHIDGTFIQPWIYADWDEERWERECACLKSLGITAIILEWTTKRDKNATQWTTCYPSKIHGTNMDVDSIHPLLEHASKNGLKVYMGLGFDDAWWEWNLSTEEDAEKFKDSMRLSAQFSREIYEMYQPGYPDVLAGFYSPYEIWNHKDWNQKALRERQAECLSDGFNILIKEIDEIAPELPLLFSPFATADQHATIENTQIFYDLFLKKTHFRKQDVMLPMDNIGGGGQSLETLEKWTAMYAAAIKKSGNKLNYYANVENFVQSRADQIKRSGRQDIIILVGDDYLGSAPIDRFFKQLGIAKKYATKIFCFSYSHYYSPVNNIPGFHEALLNYQCTGKKDTQFPTGPSIVHFSMTDSVRVDSEHEDQVKVLMVSWEGASDNFGISRVNLYKGKETVGYSFAVRHDSNKAISEPIAILYPNFQESDTDYCLGIIDVWGNETRTEPFKINLEIGWSEVEQGNSR